MKLICIALLAVVACQAHVTIRPKESKPGYYFGNIIVPHGCYSGSATNKLEMQIDPRIERWKLGKHSDWTHVYYRDVPQEDGTNSSWLELNAPEDRPETHILNDEFGAFGIQLKFPDYEVPMTEFSFPCVQYCADGQTREWPNIKVKVMSKGGCHNSADWAHAKYGACDMYDFYSTKPLNHKYCDSDGATTHCAKACCLGPEPADNCKEMHPVCFEEPEEDISTR